ncbi:hypothetical protein EDD17DRAFT_1511019 [Pisolithus thermaeus]|nr:hypothetical protein EDD17DRAFT_1511019 [Pisolithus thermaeus]
MDPETHLANLTVPCLSTLSGLEDGEIKDDEGFLVALTRNYPFPSDDSDSKPLTSKQTWKHVCETPTDWLPNNLTSMLMTFAQQFQQTQKEQSQVKHHCLDLDYWKAQVKVTTGQEECKFQLLAQCEKHVHELAMGAQEVKKMELVVQLEWLCAQNLTLQRGIAGGEDQGISGDQDVHPSPPSV